jgi:tRNA(fMet)-specific endonuclease VapC
MIRYLLDTNICIYLINKKPEPVISRLKKVLKSGVSLSSITLSELEYGVEKSQRPHENAVSLMKFLLPFDILAYDEKAANHYGIIRTDLERKGKVIGNMDMLIAAHAQSMNFTLVTNNEKEFRRIPNLSIENWTRP